MQLDSLGDLYSTETAVFDSDSIKGLSFLPRSVAIVGGGIIAVEFARIFAAMAARVTMIIRAKASLAEVILPTSPPQSPHAISSHLSHASLSQLSHPP